MVKATALSLALFLVTSASAHAAPQASPTPASTLKVPWTEPSGGWLAVGYENGSWGGHWAQVVRLWFPVLRFAGFNLKAIGFHDFRADRWDVGGRFELIGMSPVLANFVRLYGGGGVQVLGPVSGVDDKKARVGGGGQFGFEFFMNRHLAWIIEVGGNSGSQDQHGSGATIMAGLHLYPLSF